MTHISSSIVFAFVIALTASGRINAQTAAQTTPVLPSPLSLGDVVRLAGERRDEIQAARARIRVARHDPPSCPHSSTR